MSENWKAQVSVKTGAGTLINLRGDDVPDLKDVLDEFIEHVATLIPSLESSIGAVGNVASGFGGATVVATGPAPSESAAPAQAAPGGAHEVKTDRYGNEWEFNHPMAPMTPQGLKAVLKRGTSQAGKKYARWEDPRGRWVPGNTSRQDPADKWDGDFAKGV